MATRLIRSPQAKRVAVLAWCVVLGCGAAGAAVPLGEALPDQTVEPPALELRAAPAAPSTNPIRNSEIRSGNPLWSIPLSALVETRNRPIFSPSRRPIPAAVTNVPAPPPPPTQSPPPPDEPLSLTLVGTISNGTEGIAIVMEPSSRDILRLRLGEAYRGWTLSAVRGREATLEKGSAVQSLALPTPEEAATNPALPGGYVPNEPTGEVYN